MAAAGMQQPHSAFSLGSNTSATNGITGNSMVNIQYLGIFGFIYIINQFYLLEFLTEMMFSTKEFLVSSKCDQQAAPSN